MPKTKRRRRSPKVTPKTAKREIRRQLRRHVELQGEILSGRQLAPARGRKRREPPLPKIKPLDRILATLDELISVQRRLVQQIPDIMAGRRTVASWGNVEIPPGETRVFELAPTALPFRPDRLLFMPSAPGLVIESVKLGLDGAEQLVSTGVPVELYGAGGGLTAEDLHTGPFGPGDSITLRNITSDQRITVNLGMQGRIETDRARADRLQTVVTRLTAELERVKTAAPPPLSAAETN